MAEWFLERGIGETRALRLERGEIFEARVEWPSPDASQLQAGQVEDARLVSRHSGSSRGVAEFGSGARALVDRLPASASEGAMLRLQVTRPAIGEPGRTKLAHARPTDKTPRPAPDLAESLGLAGHEVREVRRFGEGDWNGLMLDALSGHVPFQGGALLLSATPAMTLIDIDGDLAPRALALGACAPVARAVRMLDIGGSIGIDFPTLGEKAERRAVDDALSRALRDWPHERTAMNGFGFVQLVARQERVSILHRATWHKAGAAARLLLRRAESLEGTGAILMAGHPALEARLRPEWLEELTRRTGRTVRFRADPGLAIEAPHAQLIEA